MFTIRIRSRIFKAAKSHLKKSQEKAIHTLQKLSTKLKELYKHIKQQLTALSHWFTKPSKHEQRVILIQRTAKRHQDKRAKKEGKQKKKRRQQAQAQKNRLKKPVVKQPAPKVNPIQEFYKEWEEGFGPALTSLDKKFLESADPQTQDLVMSHARMTLQSPYLKAVYNGLKDLVDISDLLEFDQLAKDKVKPTLLDFYERRPADFPEFLFFMHDKGIFPTRSGERKLSLDPRLVPAWLGIGA